MSLSIDGINQFLINNKWFVLQTSMTKFTILHSIVYVLNSDSLTHDSAFITRTDSIIKRTMLFIFNYLFSFFLPIFEVHPFRRHFLHCTYTDGKFIMIHKLSKLVPSKCYVNKCMNINTLYEYKLFPMIVFE